MRMEKTASNTAFSGFGITRLCTLVTFAVAAVCTYIYLDTHTLQAFLLMVQSDPWGSVHVFMLFYTAAVVLLFPCMILQVISGALYGFWFGFWVSWLATSAGQSLAFLLGRYLFRAPVKSYLHSTWPTFPVIDASIKKGGWKLVCLLRLSPVLPYNILNYALALTPVTFMVFTGASSLATIPWTVLYVYVGTFSNNLMDLAQGNISYDSDFKILISALSMLFMAITSVYGYVLSHRAITAAFKDVEDHMPPGQLVDEDISGSISLSNSAATPGSMGGSGSGLNTWNQALMHQVNGGSKSQASLKDAETGS